MSDSSPVQPIITGGARRPCDGQKALVFGGDSQVRKGTSMFFHSHRGVGVSSEDVFDCVYLCDGFMFSYLCWIMVCSSLVCSCHWSSQWMEEFRTTVTVDAHLQARSSCYALLPRLMLHLCRRKEPRCVVCIMGCKISIKPALLLCFINVAVE